MIRARRLSRCSELPWSRRRVRRNALKLGPSERRLFRLNLGVTEHIGTAIEAMVEPDEPAKANMRACTDEPPVWQRSIEDQAGLMEIRAVFGHGTVLRNVFPKGSGQVCKALDRLSGERHRVFDAGRC